MFDAVTANLLRSAPDLPDLTSEDLPRLLTQHYAELVSARLSSRDDAPTESRWPLERIADAYELIAALHEEQGSRRAAAFVAGTAHQIISRREIAGSPGTVSPIVSRDAVNPSVAAAALFLAAEQYADANEAAGSIRLSRAYPEVNALGAHIRDLARGSLRGILGRAAERSRDVILRGRIQDRAFRLLVATLADGVELLAADILSVPPPEATPRRFDTAEGCFRRVIEVAASGQHRLADARGLDMTTNYAGPAHLARLLLTAAEAISASGLSKLPVPQGGSAEFWRRWLDYRSGETPFLWPNHREIINSGFYQPNQSAVLVLPTGAGKTTISAIKIAATLASNRKVIFLAPTHALVEQLTDDLQSVFPRDLFGLEVSSDFDSLLLTDTQLQDIEVMTPERCLAMLSFSEAAFENVGLLVFDECHLLSPEAGKIGRALDGMFCVLKFREAAPNADMLFLSAMLKNGSDFAGWIENLTRRPCSYIELLWKPSRQARGVVVYDAAEVDSAIENARNRQSQLNREKRSRAKSLRKGAQDELRAVPHAVWGLQHNWHGQHNAHTFTAVASAPLQLGSGYSNGRIWVTPNANATAAAIAYSAVSAGLKTIVFVNTKADAVRVARNISAELGSAILLNEAEQAVWDALALELGDSKHSIFGAAGFGAVPHNSSMLRLERLLAERIFRRPDGAKVIVATPTLAQGLNLPAHMAILAGDKRAGEVGNERSSLAAHELLNAAGRAGRAGHLANGVVLLIPEPVVTFRGQNRLSVELADKLNSVLPLDDRCIVVSDPLELVLDRISLGEMEDRDVLYTINRLVSFELGPDGERAATKLMSKSFGAFIARQAAAEAVYFEKVRILAQATGAAVAADLDPIVVQAASQTGLPLEVLENLRARLLGEVGSLPLSVRDWTKWTMSWLASDGDACSQLLRDVSRSGCKACGYAATNGLDANALAALLPGVLGWIGGLPLNQIERELGGDPDGRSEADRLCMRARELVGTFIPRGLSFTVGVVSRMAEDAGVADLQEGIDLEVLKGLSAAVRRGFDSLGLLEYSNQHREIVGRVALHRAYERQSLLDDFDFDDLDIGEET